jgi:branched-chain amino acid transport system ATP-binding protein
VNDSAPVLRAVDLVAGYGKAHVLEDVSIDVAAGRVSAVLGPNGAGKTTLLRAIAGIIPARGHLLLDGVEIRRRHWNPQGLLKQGLAMVPSGRGTLRDLTVADNLAVGGITLPRRRRAAEAERWFTFFPRLAERRDTRAGLLSGGEQQMLAIARALMPGPRILLLDEPALGLAPALVEQVYDALGALNRDEGLSMLLVEQAAAALDEISDMVYLLDSGQIVRSGTAAEVVDDENLRRAYLGY